MNFQTIEPVNSGKFYLDVAIQKGIRYANSMSIKLRDEDKKALIKEKARVKVIKDSLSKSLVGVVHSFPGLDGLPEFYYELSLSSFDVDLVKQALSAIAWAPRKINDLERDFVKSVRGKTKADIIRAKKSFIGRVSSIMKRLNSKLDLLENTRRVLLSFPDIKDDLFTVCICGFPNVGKSTLLSKITSSKPEIGSYAFTTKSLNTGYFKHSFEKVQIVDVPGTLNRFERMNNVERQAHLAIRYLANLVVYVYDLTEPYSLAEQDLLYEHTLSLGKEVVVYFSKVDLLGEAKIKKFIADKNLVNAIFSASELKDLIISKKRAERN
ncbi:MAG: GTPase [Candidatus Woesearchaeota archaeon]